MIAQSVLIADQTAFILLLICNGEDTADIDQMADGCVGAEPIVALNIADVFELTAGTAAKDDRCAQLTQIFHFFAQRA